MATGNEPRHSAGRPSDSATDEKQIDVYRASSVALTPVNLALLHELTISVFWPHRAHDLRMLLGLGSGYLALDEIGRPLGSAMSFGFGSDFAMVGMMTTAPRLQTRGTGRWLLEKVMNDCDGRDLRLSATRSGFRLYQSVGFQPEATIRQQQGRVRAIHLPDPEPGVTLRPVTKADLPVLSQLDHPAFGADRTAMLSVLIGLGSGMIAERHGSPVGFAMIREFGKGRVIGPVVAETDRMAMQLTAPLLLAHEGQFLRLDTPVSEGDFTAFLSAAGLGVFDTVAEMRIGPQRRAQEGACLYGLAAHSLG